MQLFKTGQTTGTTFTSTGGVTSTCMSRVVNDAALGDSIEVKCANDAPYYAEGGDSGGPVWRRVGNPPDAEAVGVHFGRYGETSVFSAFAAIETELGVSLNPIAPLVVAIGGPTEIRDDDPCGWNGAVFGGRRPYSNSWTGVFTSTEPSVLGTVAESGELRLVVQSDDGQIAGDTIFINVTPNAPDCVFRAPSPDGQ
jgi:hypothetical protein